MYATRSAFVGRIDHNLIESSARTMYLPCTDQTDRFTKGHPSGIIIQLHAKRSHASEDHLFRVNRDNYDAGKS